MVGLSFVDNSDCGWMLRSPLAFAHVACGAAGEGRVRQQRVRLRVWDRFWCMVLRGREDMVALCSQGIAEEEVLWGWQTSTIQSALLGERHNGQFIALGGKHIGKGLVSLATLLQDAIESQNPADMDFQVIDMAGGMANMAGIPLRDILSSPPVGHTQQLEPQTAKTPDLRSLIGSSSRDSSGGSSGGSALHIDSGGDRRSGGSSRDEGRPSHKRPQQTDDDSDGSQEEAHHRRQRKAETGDNVIGFSEASGPNKQYATFFKSNQWAYDKKFPTMMHQLGYEKAMHGGNSALAERIRLAPSPKEAKDMAYPPPTRDRPTRVGCAPGELAWTPQQARAWRNGEDIKAFMRCLKAKYAVPELRDTLLGTGDASFEERDKTKRSRFGTGENGDGENYHGRLLRQLRDEIRAETRSESSDS